MDKSTIKLTIDGIETTVEPCTTIMKAAESIGIHIPRFCFHPGLSISGNCRICVCEVEKMPKLVTSCSTAATEGMIVHTNSERVKKARKGILELMLSEHPLDCPICDKAGECSLQDYYMEIGLHKNRFKFDKCHKPKAVKIKPHLVLDAERCILCARCVRFVKEITKTNEISIGWRGNHAEIDTFEHKGIENGYVGNLHELCPVGALTSSDFRFKCRSWFLKSHPSICPSCSTGCNILIDEKEGHVFRLRARENMEVNRYWLCDEGRYNYKDINSDERLSHPLMKVNNEFAHVSWASAVDKIHSAFSEIMESGGKIAGVASAQLTNEELYLFSLYFKDVIKNGIIGYRLDDGGKRAEGLQDGILRRHDKNPNTKGAELILGNPSNGVHDIFREAASGALAGLYIMAAEKITDPNLIASLRKARLKVKFIVVQANKKCELLELADIVLPSASFAEKEGTFTNFEGRIQRLHKAVDNVKESKTDLEIFGLLLSKAGFKELNYSAPEAFNALGSSCDAFSDLRFEDIPPQGILIKGDR